MKFLFLFLDGVGLGKNDPELNPFVAAAMPNIRKLLNGNNLVSGIAPQNSERSTLIALDPLMGVEGIPQSATGQASLLCGKNVPEMVGRHYGPKPNQEIRDIINSRNLFMEFTENGKKAALLNAYPQGYFDNINSGKRLFSAIPEAVISAGLDLKTTDDLYSGNALAADFTGKGWRTHLGFTDSPVMEEHIAGIKLAELTSTYDFSFFEYWPSDYAGHRQDKKSAVSLLESFDAVLGGLLETWADEDGLILITSDHGNLEDVSTRRHTLNDVPALVIGSEPLRKEFALKLENLADVFQAILGLYS